MKMKWVCFGFLWIICVDCGFPQGQDSNKPVIVIDPGHGGADSGAVSADGLMEKEVVLNVAFGILYWNKVLFDDRYDIYLTRYKDSLVSLSDRGKLVKAIKPDIFISLHCNHSDNPRAKGVEVYVYDSEEKKNLYLLDSIRMGEELLKSLTDNLGFVSRGVKRGDFQVLRDTKDVGPGVLLEMGFLSGKEESAYLIKETKRVSLAITILNVMTFLLK